jgi:hypothetical protein
MVRLFYFNFAISRVGLSVFVVVLSLLELLIISDI